MFRFENLISLEQFRDVERLEGEIWGPIDLVPVPIMAVSVRRGAVLVGAYDGPRLAGFVYSFPALRPHPVAPVRTPSHLSAPASHPSAPVSTGSHLSAPVSTPSHPSAPASHPSAPVSTPSHPSALASHPSAPVSTPSHPSAPVSTPSHPLAPASHWSHMLGVHPDYRGAGLGRALKLAQRERVLALGIDLIEWTYDPLQAPNAHLNFVTLGTIVEEYEENVYGESTSPLHGGLPTDRFVCQWWIARPHVARRLSRESLTLVSHEVVSAPVVNDTSVVDGWLDCADLRLGLSDRRVAVDIPLDYTQMLSAHRERARRWRFQTRELFTHYFSRGYRVVDFALHREQARGRYLLTSIPPPE